jgi:HSP20 family protein
MTMALVTRRDNGNQQLSRTRDPFSMFRDLLTWDPYDRAVSTFNPRFEIKERDDGFLFTADMPGVKEEDLDISLQNGVMTLSGTRVAEKRQENETYYAYEREYGSFSRSFALPDYADPEKIEAKLDNGVLFVVVGKRSEAKPRKVQLKKA